MRFSVSAGAENDFLAALDHYYETAGADVAIRFIEAWDDLAALLKEHPFAGSARFEATLRWSGLRSITLTSFPYLAFYTVSDDELRIVGLLHTSRDFAKLIRP